MKRKILFLDIDGVLVSRWSLLQHSGSRAPFDPQCVDQLYRIIEATGCEIVISSSWRESDLEKTKQHFIDRDFEYMEKIVGQTIRGYHYVIRGSHLPIPRGLEIKVWIDQNVRYVKGAGFVNEDYQYIILDDDSDMLLEQSENFVQTDTEIGLTRELADTAIRILNFEQVNSAIEEALAQGRSDGLVSSNLDDLMW